MKRLICRAVGHDWYVPQALAALFAPHPASPLLKQCRRCGARPVWRLR